MCVQGAYPCFVVEPHATLGSGGYVKPLSSNVTFPSSHLHSSHLLIFVYSYFTQPASVPENLPGSTIKTIGRKWGSSTAVALDRNRRQPPPPSCSPNPTPGLRIQPDQQDRPPLFRLLSIPFPQLIPSLHLIPLFRLHPRRHPRLHPRSIVSHKKHRISAPAPQTPLP